MKQVLQNLVEFVCSLLCSKRLFSGYSTFSSYLKSTFHKSRKDIFIEGIYSKNPDC